MNRISASLTVIFLLAVSSVASAATLTFEDIPPAGDELLSVPDGYGGFDWTNVGYYDTTQRPTVPSGYQNANVSGVHAAYNSRARIATVAGGRFNFISAHMTAGWNDGLNVTVTGLLNSVPKYSVTAVVGTGGPTHVNLNFYGVDEVSFESFGGVPNPEFTVGVGTHFAMDDFEYTIPEPSSALLAIMGALAVIAPARRRRR